MNLMLMIYVWAASSFNLYLLSYSIKNTAGDFFLNNFFSSLTDIPVTLLGGFLYHKFGLRVVLFSFFLIGCFGGVLIIIFSEVNKDLVPIMISIARSGIKVTFDICYLGNSFLFPAIFAGTAFGICNVGAKIFTILSPELAEVSPPTPMIVFSVLAASSAFISLFIKTAP